MDKDSITPEAYRDSVRENGPCLALHDVFTKHGFSELASEWLKREDVNTGYIFKNRYGGVISARGIAQQLKHFATEYGIDPKVVYPHSFRHRFAKNFLEKYNDIAFLADLMGHESIETTRIYLRRTATEQQQIVDKIVTW